MRPGPLHEKTLSELPPGTKPIHAGKISWGIHFCANACGACIRTRANTGKFFRGGISRVFCQVLRGIRSVRIHAAPVFRTRANTGKYSWQIIYVLVSCQGVLRGLYSHPREYRKIFLANCLCIGFVPGGIYVIISAGGVSRLFMTSAFHACMSAHSSGSSFRLAWSDL